MNSVRSFESATYQLVNSGFDVVGFTSKVAMSDRAFHSACAKSMFPVRRTLGFSAFSAIPHRGSLLLESQSILSYRLRRGSSWRRVDLLSACCFTTRRLLSLKEVLNTVQGIDFLAGRTMVEINPFLGQDWLMR